MGEMNVKDAIISCLKNQLECYSDIKNLKIKCCDDISNCLEKQMVLYKDMSRFSKILSEFDEKLFNLDNETKNDLKDYIDNYIEACIKKRDNTSKMLYFLFASFFIFLCVVCLLL